MDNTRKTNPEPTRSVLSTIYESLSWPTLFKIKINLLFTFFLPFFCLLRIGLETKYQTHIGLFIPIHPCSFFQKMWCTYCKLLFTCTSLFPESLDLWTLNINLSRRYRYVWIRRQSSSCWSKLSSGYYIHVYAIWKLCLSWNESSIHIFSLTLYEYHNHECLVYIVHFAKHVLYEHVPFLISPSTVCVRGKCPLCMLYLRHGHLYLLL